MSKALGRAGWRISEEWNNGVIWLEPKFIQPFGDSEHHLSMARRGISDRRYLIHGLLDDYIFYPTQQWLRNHIGEYNIKLYNILRIVLGFFWGINCGFPVRDITLYTAWSCHGCIRVMTSRKALSNWLIRKQ